MQYRRFGFLQARILLNKQDELRELESELKGMDNFDAESPLMVLQSREKDTVYREARTSLLTRIEDKFKEYGMLTEAPF